MIAAASAQKLQSQRLSVGVSVTAEGGAAAGAEGADNAGVLEPLMPALRLTLAQRLEIARAEASDAKKDTAKAHDDASAAIATLEAVVKQVRRGEGGVDTPTVRF